MKDILFLAHRIPYPPDRGDKIRSWNVLKHLGTLARVHLVCFADSEADAAHLEALRIAMRGSLGEAHVEVRRTGKFAAAAEALRSGKPISLTMFDSPRLRAFVEAMLGGDEIGTVYAFSGQMAQFVPEPRRQRFIMDFVDMDSAKFGDYAGSGPMRWVHRREAAKLLDFERGTAARADASLFVSPAEAELFRERAGIADGDIRAIGNGIDLDFYDPGAAFPRLDGSYHPLIVFTGQMDYRPNVQAVTHFADQCLPALLAQRPDLCFAIVGRDPTPAVLRLADRPGVIVTGSVPDVRTWLQAAEVVVAPLRIARGIQNKVLEAMAMARPVVASSAAFQGIDARAGRDLIVADTAGEQAGAILSLLANPKSAMAMAAAARRQMVSRYRWDAALAPLTELLRGESSRQAAA
jgi:sugar transferase (PEP-CTERM/EpsH1 system associated)